MTKAEYQKEYWRNNKETLKAKKKVYREKHREEEKARSKKQYEARKSDLAFKAYQAEHHAEWQRQNREKWNAYLREYRARKKAQGGEGK